jgi:protein dithiol oxidoreductase (disulfide-forming)
MQRRTTLKALAATAALVASPLLFAQSDYQLVKPPQPGGAPGTVEVIEFFSFGCGHCRSFEPAVNKWAEAQPQDVVFRKVPVSFGDPSLQPLTRMYYTLEAMGLAKKLGPAIFEAVQVQRLRLSREDVRNDWLAKQGVDLKKFNDTWRSSFSVDSQTKRADQLTTAYKIMGVPSMAINGKYIIEGAGAQTLATTDRLIAQERAAATKK